MKNIKFLLTAAVATAIFGCANNDDYNTPDLSGECVSLTATKQVTAITSASTATTQQYTADDIIEGYVTGSDEGGNIFKTVHVVNTDNTVGFSIPVDAYNTYTRYEPGRKVFINLKDKYFVKEFGSTVLGSLYNNETPNDPSDDEVGRISPVEYKSVILRGCDKVDENTLVKHLTIAQAKNDQYLNMLIELDGVQFADNSVNSAYFNPAINNLGSATNHQITDLTGSNIILRASQYATFAANKIPAGSGKIRGVLTKFNSDYQFMIRTINDVNLTQPRFDAAPAIVGNPISFGLYNQNFESFAVANRTFPNAVNDAFVGSRYWEVKTFSGNKYIEMTSFSGSGNPGVEAKTLFFIPVNFTTANTFTFKKEFRFMAGAALKVYYVTEANYTAGSAANMATFVDITSQFTGLTYPANGASQNSFTTAGTYNIPASITGNGFFVFEYSGNATITTTVQIDDIVVN